MAATIGAQVDSPLEPAKNVNTGDHSEAMLQKLDAFKKLMAPDRMGFLYDRWRNHACADPGRKGQWQSQPVYGQGWQEKEDASGGLGQLKIINWGFMWDARGRLDNLHTSAEGLQTAADQVFQKIHAAWTSKAGDAAAGKFNELRDAARAYAQDLQTLGAQMEGAWRASRHAVEQLADFANKSDVGGKPMFDRYGGDGASDDNGNESRGQWSRRIDEIERALRNGTSRWGVSAHEVIPDGTILELGGHVDQTPETVRWAGQVYLTDGDNMWADQACHWLDEMTHCYFLTIGNFRRRVEETLNEVKTNWDALNSKCVALLGDPFGKLSLAPSTGDGKQDKKTDTGGDGKKQTGGTDTGGSDTGSSPGSTGTGSTASVQPPPPVQPPPLPTPGDATTPADADTAGTEPVVDQPPGQASPKDSETVTVQDGNRKISVQSPDGEGHVKVTVDDGTGNPKTYDMDFGTGTGATPGTPGTPGTGGTGTPGQNVPGQPDGGVQTMPAPADGSAPVGQGQLTDQVQHVQAGPDGKAVVHDGDATITAERPPGSPDQVRITIDDGTGDPVTYLVDYADESGPTAQPTPAAHAVSSGQGFAGPDRAAGGDFSQRLTSEASAFADSIRGDIADPAGPVGAPVSASAEPASGFTAPGDGAAAGPQHALPEPASGFTEPVSDTSARYTGSSGFTDLFTDWSTGSDGHQSDAASAWTEPEPSMATSAQSVGFDLDTEDNSGMDSVWSTQGDLFADGDNVTGDDMDNGGAQIAPSAGEAGIASVPDNGSGQPSAASTATAAGGMGAGMPMMGGMGGSAAGGGGGDQERGPSAWTTTGDLFDDGPVTAADRISAVLDDDR